MSTRQEILDALDMTEAEVQLADERVIKRIEAMEDAQETLENVREHPCTRTVNGMTIHRYQIVAEESQNPLDDEDIHWVLTGIQGEELRMKVPGPWDSQTVPVEKFTSERFTPLTKDDYPLRGY